MAQSATAQAASPAPAKKKPGLFGEVDWIKLAITAIIGLVIWFIPVPEGLTTNVWHLFAIFVATIVGLIIKPVPMGTMAIIAITMCVLTQCVGTVNKETGELTKTLAAALNGFQNSTIWLIVIAFFISRGFIKTGLGSRVAYLFVKIFGKKTLGLSYSLLATDLILSPAMPSNTARAGGIVWPIVKSLSDTFGSKPEDGTERKIGQFLHLTAFQGDMVTSAMFMTAMAANPLAVSLFAEATGTEISWLGWAAAAIVPGLVSLIVVPFVLYKLNPPEIKETPDAAKIANEKLSEMGKISANEIKMICVFVLILVLWIAGSNIGIDATTTGFIGLVVLLLSGVLTWNDIKSEKGAWDTLVWFAALVMMAGQLNTQGLIPWFGDLMAGSVSGMNWMVALVILALAYFFSHYLFASATAHVTAMYSAFLVVAIAAGAPPMLAGLILGFFGNLFGCLTHYGSGPGPIYFGAGYCSQGKWWINGFIIGVINIIIWMVIGGLWWKVLGLW